MLHMLHIQAVSEKRDARTVQPSPPPNPKTFSQRSSLNKKKNCFKIEFCQDPGGWNLQIEAENQPEI